MNGQKRALQVVVAVGSLVPITAGAAGIVLGPAMMGAAAAPADLDSHFSYLSGLLLGVGLAFASTVPEIDIRGRRFALLTGIVMTGGIGRLTALLSSGGISRSSVFAIAMELGVTPALALWQFRVGKSCRRELPAEAGAGSAWKMR